MSFDIDKLVQDAAAAAPAARVEWKPVPVVADRVAHLDGDVMAYFYAGPDHMDAGYCRRNILSRVELVRQRTGAGIVVVHLTCGGSTKGDRYLLAESKPYQGNRSGKKKPKNWAFCRNLMTEHDGSVFVPKLWKDREADDGMHYVPRATFARNGLQVIHSNDKDMRALPGIHLNWETLHQTRVPPGTYELYGEDGLLYGHRWFWEQLVQGDSADGIPGLPRQGPAAAAACLAGTRCNADAYAAVAALYASRMGEGWEAYLAEQASLLWLRGDRWATPLDFLSLGVFPHNVQEAAWHLADRAHAKRLALEKLRK